MKRSSPSDCTEEPVDWGAWNFGKRAHDKNIWDGAFKPTTQETNSNFWIHETEDAATWRIVIPHTKYVRLNYASLLTLHYLQR